MTTATLRGLPPGPDEPVDEQLAGFEADPFGCVERMTREYGDLFTLRLGGLGNEDLVDVEHNGAWVFLTRPDQLRAMYAPDAGTSGALANQLFFGTPEESVGYIDGTLHRRRRSQLHPAFSGGRDYAAIITTAVDEHVARWPRGERFDLFTALQALTSDIIAEVVCGGMPTGVKAEIAAMLPRMENAKYSRDEVVAADRELRAYLDRHLSGHRQRCDAAGVDDVSAALQRHAEAGDEALTDEVVRDEVFSLLYTGFSTTANALSWAFLEVLADQRVRDRLMAEIGDRFATRPVPGEAAKDLDYVDAVLSEALRLHPVSALNGVRMVVEPLVVDGHELPAGTVVVHCAHVIQRDPRNYEDPLVFRPERFLGAPVDPYVFGAFGGGARMCVGRGYARAEMRVILAMVLASVDMRAVGPVPAARQQGIFMAPERTECVVEDR
ncbi:cytochrome P450 [Actinokineospora sp. PR83]|uniref:cytochrome P450 n=1 Tax=Actinokineospora sp. PR83 TaxID=2884908 RepID=UPI001F1FE71B|nr:cytochrome P450 [Actinokineospora sp. PR83]MCG8917240.1 cytochrome P450 [Actinokineospora sp. PR83]